MKTLALLAALLSALAASAFAASVTVPEAGLPEGRLAPAVALGLPSQPISSGQWSAFQAVIAAGASEHPELSSWARLSATDGRLAAAPMASLLPDSFWVDAARVESLAPERRAQLVSSLELARKGASVLVEHRAGLAVESAQELIAEGRFGEGDLDALANALENLSGYGDGVRAAALEVRGALALSRARRAAGSFSDKPAEAVPEGPAAGSAPLAAPSAPARPEIAPPVDRAPISGDRSWIRAAARVGALAYLADWATKAFANAHLFSVFHEVAWREPLMAVIIPYMLFTVYMARTRIGRFQVDYHWSWRRLKFTKERLPGLDEIKAAHPSLIKALSRYDVAIGLMIGGLLGNGIDAFIKHGALDWIPVGRSMMNLADVAILLGLSYFQVAGKFFVTAARAAREGKAMNLDLTNFLGLPAIGFLAAWALGSAPSTHALALQMKGIGWVYLMGFSMLIGAARYLVSLLVRRDVKKFNDESPRS